MMSVAFATLFGASHANAQSLITRTMERMYFGPKVEANASGFFLLDTPGTSSQIGFGGSAGGFIGFRLGEHFSVQEDILVHYQTSQLKTNGIEADYRNLGVELSFYAVGHWNVGNNRILVGAGPFVSCGLDAKYDLGNTEIDLYEENAEGEKPCQPFSVGAAVMLGYEWKCGLQVNASCKVGILDQFDAWKAKATILPYRIGLGAAWRFGH